MTTNEARKLFSEYLDGTLDAQVKDNLQAYLSANPESAAELMQFERTLSLVHRLPQEEPTMDMWAELAPKLALVMAERKQSPFQRFSHRWADFRSSLSEGVILWTHLLAARSHAKLGKYLLRDPLKNFDND